MPTVEVCGNLEDALAVFKRKSNAEGIVLQCKRAQAFIPASEQRRWNNIRRERKTRKQAEIEARRAEW